MIWGGSVMRGCVCRVRSAWAGWNDGGGGFVVEEGGVEERKEKEGRSASYCLSLEG